MLRTLLSAKLPVCRQFLRLSPFSSATTSRLPNDGKTLADFFDNSSQIERQHVSYSEDIKNRLKGHSFVIETYGCQMNRADSEIMETLLHECGMVSAEREKDADVIIMNTCSVREHAESRIWNRLAQFRNLDKKYKKKTVKQLVTTLY